MSPDWATVRERVERETAATLERLHEEWGDAERLPPFTFAARHHDPDTAPNSVAEQYETIAGIASVLLFYTAEHRETVLVYNPKGGWEPPGGVIEAEWTPAETARTEAREETGLAIELTDLAYTRRVRFEYPDGNAVDLPVAQFVGHRVGGELGVEKAGHAHPGMSRGVGLFDRETLPELRRERERLLDRLNDPPAWDGEG